MISTGGGGSKGEPSTAALHRAPQMLYSPTASSATTAAPASSTPPSPLGGPAAPTSAPGGGGDLGGVPHLPVSLASLSPPAPHTMMMAASPTAAGSAASAGRSFSYLRASDIELPLAIRVLDLSLRDVPPDTWIEIAVEAAGERASPSAVVPLSRFGYFVLLPLRYCDLTLCARILVEVRSCCGVLAHSAFRLFRNSRKMRAGARRLELKRGPDGAVAADDPLADMVLHSDPRAQLERRVARYHRGELPRVEWMDARCQRAFDVHLRSLESDASALRRPCSVFVEMPRFDHPIIYFHAAAVESVYQPNLFPTAPSAADSVPAWGAGHELPPVPVLGASFVNDPEIRRVNPVEDLKSIQPSVSQRKHLQLIADAPPTQPLTLDERAMLWRYADFLKTHIPTALPKLMRSVDWLNPKLQIRAEITLRSWGALGLEHALELLSFSFKFIEPVRSYAIQILASASDEELLLYLLSLVHSLRYGRMFVELGGGKVNVRGAGVPTGAAGGDGIGAGGAGSTASADAAHGVRSMLESSTADLRSSATGSTEWGGGMAPSAGVDPLADFLIARAVPNRRMAVLLFWYLTVETEDRVHGESFRRTLLAFLSALDGSSCGTTMRRIFEQQKQLVARLVQIHRGLLSQPSRNKKAYLEEQLSSLRRFEHPIPLPVDPDIEVIGIVAEEASFFNSKQMPLKIPFRTASGATYMTMFKCGDDLRQDQLVLQLFRLMDLLLRKESLNLRMTVYSVLATSSSTGFLEFVTHSLPLQQVYTKYVQQRNPIQVFLRLTNPDPANRETGIASSAMDAFVRSNAGYCVMTYVLGIGDRHNDNILLAEDGRLFHVDFGYILGHEPPLKGNSTPFKLNKKMVLAMAVNDNDNWRDSPHFVAFKTYACETFNILRSHANLILNVFTLMVDANITDIARFGPQRSISEVQRKFDLKLSNEEAIHVFQELIESSIHSLWTGILDSWRDLRERRRLF